MKSLTKWAIINFLIAGVFYLTTHNVWSGAPSFILGLVFLAASD